MHDRTTTTTKRPRQTSGWRGLFLAPKQGRAPAVRPGPKERKAMGREPAWGCGLPRRGRLTRSPAAISLGRLPAGKAGRQGEGGNGTGARMGMRAPKEREAHSVRMVRISFGTALRPGRVAGPRRGRLTRSLAAISLGRLPAGKAGRQGEGGEASVLGALCLLLSTLQTIYQG